MIKSCVLCLDDLRVFDFIWVLCWRLSVWAPHWQLVQKSCSPDNRISYFSISVDKHLGPKVAYEEGSFWLRLQRASIRHGGRACGSRRGSLETTSPTLKHKAERERNKAKLSPSNILPPARACLLNLPNSPQLRTSVQTLQPMRYNSHLNTTAEGEGVMRPEEHRWHRWDRSLRRKYMRVCYCPFLLSISRGRKETWVLATSVFDLTHLGRVATIGDYL